MTMERLLEIVGATLLALAGGGGLWTWLVSRRKSHVEADVLANKSAIEAMLQSVEFLKARVSELENENTAQRDLADAMRVTLADMQAENEKLRAVIAQLQDEIHNAEAKRQVDAQRLQVQMAQVSTHQAEQIERLRAEYEACKRELMELLRDNEKSDGGVR